MNNENPVLNKNNSILIYYPVRVSRSQRNRDGLIDINASISTEITLETIATIKGIIQESCSGLPDLIIDIDTTTEEQETKNFLGRKPYRLIIAGHFPLICGEKPKKYYVLLEEYIELKKKGLTPELVLLYENLNFTLETLQNTGIPDAQINRFINSDNPLITSIINCERRFSRRYSLEQTPEFKPGSINLFQNPPSYRIIKKVVQTALDLSLNN